MLIRIICVSHFYSNSFPILSHISSSCHGIKTDMCSLDKFLRYCGYYMDTVVDYRIMFSGRENGFNF